MNRLARFFSRFGGGVIGGPPPNLIEKAGLMVTLWPSFPHFGRFAKDTRLAGIRLNSAMISNPELEVELNALRSADVQVPLFFDVKGRQLRVEEAKVVGDHLEVDLNHPVYASPGTVVLFKAEREHAQLHHVSKGGWRLVFRPRQPESVVVAGESIHIRAADFRVLSGPQFTNVELAKIAQVKAAGFTRWFLSYVQSARDVAEFRELVGKDAEVWLKIEDQAGLEYVRREFRKAPGLTLVAARGDMYIEVAKPHDILPALRLIIERDPEACVGSRIMLSLVRGNVPDCADFLDLAWLHDVGYRRFMICDELCLKESLLASTINAFEAFRSVQELK
ncbi:MAG TPA: hypothetical protein VJJ22_00210 [Candidatus Paceibacterota bacterium]